MDMVTEISALTELVVALEQATLMAKQLPNTADPSQIIQIYATLHSAHHRLSTFLSQTAQQPHPPPQPSLLLPPPSAAENSVSSSIGNGDDDEEQEPMQLGDQDEDDGEYAEAEQNSKITIERVEERMKDCFIQNKRSKRPLSPASAAAAEEQQRSYEKEFGRGSSGLDPRGTRLRSLDLISQFHA